MYQLNVTRPPSIGSEKIHKTRKSEIVVAESSSGYNKFSQWYTPRLSQGTVELLSSLERQTASRFSSQISVRPSDVSLGYRGGVRHG